MMRIAVLATSRHPLRQPWAGGQESQTAGLVQALRRRGHYLRLYAPRGSDPGLADELRSYPEPPTMSAVSELDPHLPEPDFLRDQTAFMWAMTDLLRTDDVDLVHNQSLHHLPLAMSAALRPPLVATLHTPPFPWMEVGAALASPGTTFVVVSGASARDWYMLPSAPVVIPNGVPVAPGVGRGGPDLLWMGRICPEKGLDLAIDAARLAGRRLRIAGPISDQAYFEQSVAPRLGADVEHLGHLTSPELTRQIDRCAASLVTPCWEEPFGLVAAESMVRGTPVVALARGGLPEVIGAESGVLVGARGPRWDIVRGLAEAVDAAVLMPRRQVARAAQRERGEDTMVSRYEELFEGLVRGRDR